MGGMDGGGEYLGKGVPICRAELGVLTRWRRPWARAHAYVNAPSWPLALMELRCRVVKSWCEAGGGACGVMSRIEGRRGWDPKARCGVSSGRAGQRGGNAAATRGDAGD